MVVDHNMSQMVNRRMSETGNRSHRAHSHRVELSLDSIGQHATALVNAVAGGVDREAAACDLTPMEFAGVRLFPIDMEWTVTELAQMLSVDASSMSRVVNKLVDRGLLRRRRPREDRRLVFLKLTKDGVALGLELHEKAHFL